VRVSDANRARRGATSLLHRRETRACDLEETVAYLRKDLKTIDMQQTVALMYDIDEALSDGKVDSVRLY